MLGKRKVIALCISKIHDTSSYEFIKELSERLSENGDSLFVYNTCSDLYWNRLEEKGKMSVYDLIPYQIVDAIVIFEEKIKNKPLIDRMVSKAVANNVPTIVIGEQYEGCSRVRFNYQAGFEAVVRHIIEKHHVTKLHMMSGSRNNIFSKQREEAFANVLEQHGISFYAQSMVSYGDFWSEPARIATEKLLEREELPQAIVCANDNMAISVCNVLKKHGYSVPGDILVTGFDGIVDIQFSEPKITSCITDHVSLADHIYDMLVKCFAGGSLEEHCEITPNLILSESCGCRKTYAVNASEYVSVLNNRVNSYLEKELGLSETSAKIQNCETLKQVSKELYNAEIMDMCCLLRQDCIDETVNPHNEPEGDIFSGNMCLLYDSDATQNFAPCTFPAEEIIPNLQEVLERGKPLIFTALNFLNIPLGYVCFHFKDYDVENYYRLPQIVSSLNSAIGGYRNVRYQHYLAIQIEEMYQQDILTGLYNRNGLMRAWKDILSRHGQRSEGILVILADLDGLKHINDNFGHGEGDSAIHTVAQALKNSCPEGSVCARFGGDEMLAIYDGTCDFSTIRQGIKEYLAAYNETSQKPYIVDASVGFYTTDENDILDIEVLMKKADERMYAEKSAKKK